MMHVHTPLIYKPICSKTERRLSQLQPTLLWIPRRAFERSRSSFLEKKWIAFKDSSRTLRTHLTEADCRERNSGTSLLLSYPVHNYYRSAQKGAHSCDSLFHTCTEPALRRVFPPVFLSGLAPSGAVSFQETRCDCYIHFMTRQ